jgi:type I restriction enzyme S subunit
MNADRLLAHYERIADVPDAVTRLRRFILDLAVRGKLVPQSPKDEPASKLLHSVSVERARLLAARILKKDREAVCVGDDEAPFSIPSLWTFVRLGTVLEMFNGRAFKPTEWTASGLPIVRIQNLNNESASFNYCDHQIVDERHLIRDNDFLISWSGTPGTSFGAFIWKRGAAALNQHIFRCVQIGAAFDQKFLRLAINSQLDVLIAQAQGGVGLQHVTKGTLESLPLPLPPVAEQRRIVCKVDELMALCDRLETTRAYREATRDRLTWASVARLNTPDPNTFQADAIFLLGALPKLTTRGDQIRHLRKTILNLAVRGKLVPQDLKDEPAEELLKRIAKERTGPQEIKKARRNGKCEISSRWAITTLPMGWRWTNIDEIALSMRYGTSTKCEYASPGVPVLRIPNVSIKFGPLNEIEIRDLALRAGDILMIRSNGSLDIVGRAAVVTAEAVGMAFAGYLVRLRSSPPNMNPEYIWLALNSTDVRDQIERPIRSAVGLKNINLTEFGALTFPFPPLAEQNRIVAKVDELMALCDRLEASLAADEDTRRRLLSALLHEALTPVDGLALAPNERVAVNG